MRKLFLASQSPRRRELLAQLGYSFEVIDAPIAEVRGASEAPLDYVQRVAREKAGAGLLTLAAVPDAVILAADTEVVLDDEVFGKPRDRADARAMLLRLAGRTHSVISAVSVLDRSREAERVVVSEVTMAILSDADVDAYLDTGESFGKAGAYAIQGRAAAFITHLLGSYSGVMGLPLYDTEQLLRQFNVQPRIATAS